MYKSTINRHEFIYKNGDPRVVVYEVGAKEPLLYINSGVIRNEKDFHYEIMQWYSTHIA